MPELKLCPFCGSDDLERVERLKYGGYFVRCNDCGVETDNFALKSEAIEAWNRRT